MFIDSKEVVRVSVNGFTFACMHAKLVNRIRLFVTPWTVVCQTPLSIEFSRQEYWSKLSCPLLGDLPNSGIKLMILKSPALAGRLFTASTTWEAPKYTGLVLLYSMV